ncbi:MAG: hypothetical protein B7733_24200 [Myxococcales bacterium FL481]|nr:MAG: hypothetical protein B7733_24200 [Myxococcales bacterium FL481]
MNAVQRYFHGAYGSSRAHLLSRGFLLLVALDAWTIMLGHSAKYGFKGFNTAHFPWLDPLIPGHNRALYQAVLLGCGMFAVLATFLGGRRPLVLGACVLHWLSWSMSMLDSYQHHYFTSLVLTCMVVWPRTTANSVHPLPSPKSDAVGEDGGRSARPGRKSKRRRERNHEPAASSPSRTATDNNWHAALFALGAMAVVVAVSQANFIDHAVVSTLVIGGFAVVITWAYRRAPEPGPTLTRGFGYPLLGATIGIVYTYTSLAKLDWDWLEGHTVRRLSADSPVLEPVLAVLDSWGIDHAQFWSAMAVATIVTELCIALGYMVAPTRDRNLGRAGRAFLWATWVMAMGLHIGIEAIELRIGWFSFYMLTLGCVFMLPLSVVDRWATVLTWPAQTFSRWVRAGDRRDQVPAAGLAIAASLGTIGLLAFVGHALDLPGGMPFAVAAGCGVLGVTIWRWPSPRRAGLLPALAATAVASILMAVAVTQSTTRFDFYRRLGKDYARQLDLEASLEAYLKAEHYAPSGKSRRATIRKLRKQLDRQRD